MPPVNALKGIILVTLAVMAFAMADVATKHLTMLYAVPLVVTLRYAVNLALLVIVLGPRHRWDMIKIQRKGLVVARAGCLVVGSLTMGLALRYMPVAETVAIVYLSPLIVMLLAIPILGEKVPLAGWIGAAIGFAGVLLIVRPGAGLNGFGVALSLINAVAASFYHLLTRVLAKTETTPALLFHTAWIGFAAFAAMMLVTETGPIPQGADWAYILALGVLATAGHFLFTAAYREAPASLLAPVNYMHLVWAGLLGLLVFGHWPDAISLFGMALVAAAGAGVALRAHLVRQANRAPLE